MKYVYVGKEVVSDSLKARAEKKLGKLDRYFDREAEAIIRLRQQRGAPQEQEAQPLQSEELLPPVLRGEDDVALTVPGSMR